MGKSTVSQGAERAKDPEKEPKIQKVGLIDQNDNFLSGSIKQYVNLPKNQNFVDGNMIQFLGQLTQKLRYRVRFNIEGSHSFKIKLLPHKNNMIYSGDEKNRNPNFNYQDQEFDYTTDSNGEIIIEDDNLFVSPAGGDFFELLATAANDKPKKSRKFQTQRMMYYVEVKMAGLTSIANTLEPFKKEFDKYNILFHGLSNVSISHMENIGEHDGSAFLNSVQTAYNTSQGPAKSPFCVAIAYTDHLAVKDNNKRISVYNVVVGTSNDVTVNIEDRVTPTNTKRHALWNNIVTGEDWFVECYFVKNGGNAIVDKISINRSKCTPVQKSGYPIGYYDSVDIDVSNLDVETGTITLIVNWVNRMRAGLSYGNTNIVAICTRAWWQTIATNEQNQIMVHEVGHQLKMVTDGTGILPDKTTNYYNTSKGHVGNHCHSGIPTGQARYDSQSDGNLSKCVMYGATNGHIDFCLECAKAVKKLDLSNGV